MGGQAPGLKFFDLLHQIFTDDPAAPDTLAAVLKALEGLRSRVPAERRIFCGLNCEHGTQIYSGGTATLLSRAWRAWFDQNISQ
jgi:hypothetical protein